MPVHQLCHVLVPGGDHGIDTLLACLAGQRTDDIVRFHVRDLQQRQAHGPHDGQQGFHLGGQFLGHRRPVRLVFRVQRVAKGLAAGVEYHRHVLRPVLPDQAAQHVGDAVNGTGRLAPGIAQLLQVGDVKGAIQVGRPVNQQQGSGLFLGHDSLYA